MSLPLGATLLFAAVTVAARCSTCSVSLPKQTASTTLRLTAHRNDTGFWTTQFGEYQMTIEHMHYDSTKDDNDDEDSTWSIKVKYTCTVCQDETKTHSTAFGQLKSTISKLTDKNTAMRDRVVSKTVKDAVSSDDGPFGPFVADSETDAELNLPYEDVHEETELRYDALLPYESPERRRNETLEDTHNKREELDKLTVVENRRKITERYPRSRSPIREHYDKGYRFYYGIGWLKLNTSAWQWPEAREACGEDGAHLAIPDTTQKIGAMRQILKDNADILQRTVLKNQVYVGLFYPDRGRNLTTVLGKSFQKESDTDWFPDEPNNAPPGEECITLHLEGKMRDVPCFYTLPFFCEID